MPEHAMHHHMQVVPHRDLLRTFIAPQNMLGIIEQILAVGEEGIILDLAVSELAQSHIQKSQIDKQGVSGQMQYILRQLI